MNIPFRRQIGAILLLALALVVLAVSRLVAAARAALRALVGRRRGGDRVLAPSRSA
jgi:hypothetical protein